VEALIARLPEVVSVAVHGVPSAQLESEHEIKACVLLAEGSTLGAAEIARFVNDHAPHWYVPRYVEFVDAMPMTPTGRIQKNQLRDRDVTGPVWDRDVEGFEVVR
jgi:crotonobetaine/carnitine-CoA ligase